MLNFFYGVIAGLVVGIPAGGFILRRNPAKAGAVLTGIQAAGAQAQADTAKIEAAAK
jgi:hypothetical protein